MGVGRNMESEKWNAIGPDFSAVPPHPFVMPRAFVAGVEFPDNTQPGWWFAFCRHQILLNQTGQIPLLSGLNEIGLSPVRTQFLGTLAGKPCYSAELAKEIEIPEGLRVEGLRSQYTRLDDDLFALAGRAYQIMEWDRTHQYCGHCATEMMNTGNDRAKRCPNCGLRQYPRLSPAIIVLISRGNELLLARAPRFREGLYSVLAGFVEPGESLEETVAREVYEEVGIAIKDIRYFGSQPWPFPNSLMIGFTASYAGGEIVIDGKEIEAANWFTKENLPPVPGPLSIARQLIEWFVAEC
ncbi:MAG: NAD(+) diphosphatase [Cyanobacteria bacterium P01_A01_bin.114]